MKIYYTESKNNGEYHKVTIESYNRTEIVLVDDEDLEGFEQCLNALGFIKEPNPCDNGECSDNVYDCRNFGVDENKEEYYPDLEAEPTEFEKAYMDRYTPSVTNGDYGPSNPWDAPGMSIHDFI